MMEIYLDEVGETQCDEFDKHFKFIDYLASGSFGTVIKALNKEKDMVIAVKIINKRENKHKNISRLKQEITILKQLKHPHIVEFYGFIETPHKIYIMMEYIESGTLKTFIDKRKEIKFSEDEVSTILRCLISAVEYLHFRDICHRDIKPENIMFKNINDLKTLKLVDFGLSAQYFEVLEEYDYCGTLIYMAPEQIEKRVYSKAIDMWSVGIIFYMLMNNGNHPLYKKGDKSHDYIEKLKNSATKIDMKGSQMARMLLKKLLDHNPSHRYSAESAIRHPWITRRFYDDIPKNHLETWKTRNLKKKFNKVLGSLIFLINFKKNKTSQQELNNSNDTLTNNGQFYLDGTENDSQLLMEYQTKADYHSKIEDENFRKFREKCCHVIDNYSEENPIQSENVKNDVFNRDKFKLADIDYYTTNLDLKIPANNGNIFPKRIEKVASERKIKINLQKGDEKNNVQNKQYKHYKLKDPNSSPNKIPKPSKEISIQEKDSKVNQIQKKKSSIPTEDISADKTNHNSLSPMKRNVQNQGDSRQNKNVFDLISEKFSKEIKTQPRASVIITTSTRGLNLETKSLSPKIRRKGQKSLPYENSMKSIINLQDLNNFNFGEKISIVPMILPQIESPRQPKNQSSKENYKSKFSKPHSYLKAIIDGYK